MRGSCFDMEAVPSAEEPKAAEVPTASPETKEASEVKAEVAEEAKEAAEAGNVISLWSKICRGHEWQAMAYPSVETNVPLWCLSLSILEIMFFVGLLKLEWQAPAAKGPAKGPGKGPAKGPAKGKGKSPAEAKGIKKE